MRKIRNYRNNFLELIQNLPCVKGLANGNQPTAIPVDDLIDNCDVMRMLHISSRTLQKLRSNGTLPYTCLGRKIIYSRKDIENILNNNYVMYNLQRHGKDKQ